MMAIELIVTRMPLCRLVEDLDLVGQRGDGGGQGLSARIERRTRGVGGRASHGSLPRARVRAHAQRTGK